MTSVRKALRNIGISWDERAKKIIFATSKQYEKLHSILKVLGISEPVNLESIYTTVQILNNRSLAKVPKFKLLRV